ncbi:hypothetical protein OJ962_20235 [Solirubrobacter sp. CPCC 204708]|uniref:Uncharacterized protein n=1 Tax=Solirubrobacter deserti TaxID=2282478 RepID=A0ABT4RMP3_9ACTN|nr:hypothetical protein [Solirubrobacter deserti]MDA0139842.1 hypothetical protein [Solirubrobacter deserti]
MLLVDLAALRLGRGRILQRVERRAGVAVGVDQQPRERRLAERVGAAEAALGIGERALDDLAQVVVRQRRERIDLQPRPQRADDLVPRMLGGGAQQRDGAVLDVRQQRVLLGLRPARDLVDEQDRHLSHGTALRRAGDDLAQIGDPVRHRVQRLERGRALPRDRLGDRRLPAPWRAP